MMSVPTLGADTGISGAIAPRFKAILAILHALQRDFIELPLWPNQGSARVKSLPFQFAGPADTMRRPRKVSIACATDPTVFDRQLSETSCSRSLLFET